MDVINLIKRHVVLSIIAFLGIAYVFYRLIVWGIDYSQNLLESQVIVDKAEILVKPITTSELKKGEMVAVHLILQPTVKVTYVKSVKKFEILNFKTGQIGKGKFVVFKPKSISASTPCINETGDICSKPLDMNQESVASISYSVVSERKSLDEVTNALAATPYFVMGIKDVGVFSYDEVAKSNPSINKGELIKYLSIKPEDLSFTLEFDVKVTLTDGRVFTKHVAGDIDGQKVLSEYFYTVSMK